MLKSNYLFWNSDQLLRAFVDRYNLSIVEAAYQIGVTERTLHRVLNRQSKFNKLEKFALTVYLSEDYSQFIENNKKNNF